MTICDEVKRTQIFPFEKFLEFWDFRTGEDSELIGYNLDNVPSKAGCKNIVGLGATCHDWLLAGNSLKGIKLQDLVNYISDRDPIFRSRINFFIDPQGDVMDFMETLYNINHLMQEQLEFCKEYLASDVRDYFRL